MPFTGDYNCDNPSIINIDSIETSLKMFDKLTRIGDGRRVQPFDRTNNVLFSHRFIVNEYSLQIGDTCFMIPPEFIMVTSESTSQPMVTLRQENTVRKRSGFHKRTILIDLVFNGLNQINGYRIPSPEGYYYVDGLRQLLAQFKCTPFLPINNELINGMYGIFTVVLQTITISTVPGFPDVMTAQLTLQEVDMFPYIEMPNVCFEKMIDWDLFRFYYQRLLTETNEYRKLQSIQSNREHNRFKISLLDDTIFSSKDARQYNLLEIICDQKIIHEDAKTNYKLWLNSDDSDVVISSFQCGYSNILTNIQLSDCSCPTVQFMGGMDTIYNIQFETTDYLVVQALEACRVANDAITRNNPKFHSLGFVKLDCELVAFTGSLFVMIDTVTTNTVPGFPNLYNVQINCVAYDIAQSDREDLYGFRPFECSDCTNSFYPDHVHGDGDKDETIEQTMSGLEKKIRQDNYAEWKIRSNVELYPDLRLPKYSEVNTFIKKCNSFRQHYGLDPLPYNIYPVNPTCMLHGNHPTKNAIDMPSSNNGVVDAKDIPLEGLEYDVYVDPDFYVFYPWSYSSFKEQEGIDGQWYDIYKAKTRDTFTKKVTFQEHPFGQTETETHTDNISTSTTGDSSTPLNSTLVEQFIYIIEQQVGCRYVLGAEGAYFLGARTFDCSGLVTFGLKQIGILNERVTTSTIVGGSKHFKKVNWNNLKRGDVIAKYKNGKGHVVIYCGNDTIVHAKGKGHGVKRESLSKTSYLEKNGYGVYRVKKFEVEQQDTGASQVATASKTSTGSSVKATVWNQLKSLGFTDYAAAGIMGNMVAESNIDPYNVQGTWKLSQSQKDELCKNYVSKVDSGEVSEDEFAKKGPSGYATGFGLVQFTHSAYKRELYKYAKQTGKSVADIGVQLTVFCNQIKSSGVYDKINTATSIQQASNIMLLDYEKPAKKDDVDVQKKRAEYATEIYNEFANGSNSTSNSGGHSFSGPTLTKSEFNAICKAVTVELEGTNLEDTETTSKLACGISQFIFDRLVSGKFGNITSILNDALQFHQEEQSNVIIPDIIKEIVEDVFCEARKQWANYSIYAFVSPFDPNEEFTGYYDILEQKYDKVEEISSFVFWGEKRDSKLTRYSIVEDNYANGTSSNTSVITTEVTHEAKFATVDMFAEPVLVETDCIIYDEGFESWTNGSKKSSAKEVLNDTTRIFGSSFVDEAQYSCRGRLVKAFPTYLFCIVDDNAQWYDGRKLWSNYYITKSVIDIAVHETNDMPTATATVTVSNLYKNLSKTQAGLSSYSLTSEMNAFEKMWYNVTGNVWQFGGPHLTDKMIKLHQVIYNNARLREGARVHLRMGYGSDPLSLAPMINGSISDITVGDQISMIITSDGIELTQHVISASESTNNGVFGLFGFAEDQEPSNIIAKIMSERQSWANVIVGDWFEGSKYSIEHFGLYFNQSVTKTLLGLAAGAGVGGGIALLISVLGGPFSWGLAATSTVIGGIGGMIADENTNIQDVWNGNQEQYDLLKNIYKADYSREHYIYSDFIGWDGEKNVVFNYYNMTPWDVFQICAQSTPEYIVKPSYHQFDSRLYFGLPFWMEKYRYDYIKTNKDTSRGKVYEECKSACQVHIVDSLTNIIDNQVRVTNRYSNTNIKVMYTRGNSPTSTQTIHSDDTIDYSKQKTGILDTSITQDALGPDALWELLQYKVGERSARRVGISNLLYGWQQQYQGQIICLGMPGVRAHDYLMIYDTYVEMYGLALTREVVHTFSMNSGFTTSIVPGMIGFSTDNQSGLVEVCKNYLNLLNHFSSFLYTRHTLKNNYETNLNLFSNMKVAESKAELVLETKARINTTGDVISGGVTGLGVAYTGYKVAAKLYEYSSLAQMKESIIAFAKGIPTQQTANKLITAFMTGFNTVMKADDVIDTTTTIGKVGKGIKGLMNFFNGVSKGVYSIVTLAVTPKTLIIYALWIIVDMIIGEIIEWFKNRNVCCLLPLWWEGQPFVSGVKDGQKILLASDETGNLENPNEDNDY